jgi:hypothetical protein
MKKEFSPMRTGNRFGGDNIPLLLAGSGLLYSILTLDRAFITGFAFALLISLALHPVIQLRGLKLGIAGGLLLLLPLLLTVGVKTGSTRGRLLIYKISANIFRDHFPQGTGWGNFKVVYNHYQAEYFRKGIYTVSELLTADNTYFAFNDYFQWIIEGGWIALIVIIPGLAALGWYTIHTLKRRSDTLYIIAVTQLAALLIAACFTHVFERTGYQCMAIAAIGIIFFRWPYALLMAGMALIIHHAHYIKHYEDYQQLKMSQGLAAAGNRRALLNTCEHLYPDFNKQPEFLMVYGSLLLDIADRKKAPGILQQACTLHPHNNWLVKLGEAYESAGDTAAAEASYLHAVYMVPNRFATKMQLFTFYERCHRQNSMMNWGRVILQQPVKVPSAQVDRIRKIVKEKMAALLTTPSS